MNANRIASYFLTGISLFVLGALVAASFAKELAWPASFSSPAFPFLAVGLVVVVSTQIAAHAHNVVALRFLKKMARLLPHSIASVSTSEVRFDALAKRDESHLSALEEFDKPGDSPLVVVVSPPTTVVAGAPATFSLSFAGGPPGLVVQWSAPDALKTTSSEREFLTAFANPGTFAVTWTIRDAGGLVVLAEGALQVKVVKAVEVQPKGIVVPFIVGGWAGAATIFGVAATAALIASATVEGTEGLALIAAIMGVSAYASTKAAGQTSQSAASGSGDNSA
jgi:hypothetical protein